MKQYLLLIALFSVAACQAKTITITGNAYKTWWKNSSVISTSGTNSTDIADFESGTIDTKKLKFFANADETDNLKFQARCLDSDQSIKPGSNHQGYINGVLGWVVIEDGKTYNFSCP